MLNDNKISLYVDALIFETIAVDSQIIKNADGSVISDITNSIKKYFESHIDPNNKVSSFLNILAPVGIYKIFSAIGKPGIGILLGIASRVFHFDVASILNSIYQYISNIITSGGKLTSNQINTAVSQAVSSNTDSSIFEPTNILEKLKDKDSLTSLFSDDGITSYRSVTSELRQAKLLKFTLMQYESGLLTYADAKTKSSISDMLKKVLSFFFTTALAAGGFMILGDIGAKALGIGGNSSEKPVPGYVSSEAPQAVAPTYKPTQTKFKVSSSYFEDKKNIGENVWVENYTSNRPGIELMVLDFAIEVYPDLKGKEDIIRSTRGFNQTVDIINFSNKTHMNHSIVILPRIYYSEKQIVDNFIDEVAKHT